MKKPKLLKFVDINKMLTTLKKFNKILQQAQIFFLDVNKLVTTVIGQNVKYINNLKDMSKFNL